MWPGFGENMRVLKWMVARCQARIGAVESVLGWIPSYEDIDWNEAPGMTREKFAALMKLDTQEWQRELESHGELFTKLHSRLPQDFPHKREVLQQNFK
jgi:phosphoenolpyruvate carboxykinase (GTP)